MSKRMHNSMRNRLRELPLESGQTMSEYAVVLIVLIPGAVLLFSGFAGTIATGITSVARLFP